MVGKMYATVLGYLKNWPKLFKWYLQAAKGGDLFAQYLCRHLFMTRVRASAPDRLRHSVNGISRLLERESPIAQYALGQKFANGDGVPIDYEKAREWLLRAAEQGNMAAQYTLGLMYVTGMGVPVDNEEAFKWYLKAAVQGDMASQYNIGAMYANGLGVEVNHAKAMAWFHRSAKQGFVHAEYGLGVMYVNGKGTPVDYEAGRKWYRRAALQGDADAQYHLGIMYALGKGAKSITQRPMSGYQPQQKWKVNGQKAQKDIIAALLMMSPKLLRLPARKQQGALDLMGKVGNLDGIRR